MRTFKQSRSFVRLPATFLLAVLLLLSVPFGVRADEDEQRSFSEGLWQNGFYESTLGDMAGRRLYVYGIADNQSGENEVQRDDQIVLLSDNPVTRLEVALMLYRLCGTNVIAAECPFSDVPDEYREAVGWLYASGVTHGISADRYGTDEITRVQFLAMLSRLLGWETSLTDRAWDEAAFEAELTALAMEHDLLPAGRSTDAFTHGDAYLILLALMEQACPALMVPVRPELSRPNQITLYAHSFQDAEEQIASALFYAPARLGVVFEDDCTEEDIEAFQRKYDLDRGEYEGEIPFITEVSTAGGLHGNLSQWSERAFRFSFSSYAPAYLAYLDMQDWLRCFHDERYSARLLEFRDEMLLPLIPEDAGDYAKARAAHDLLVTLASYDHTEYHDIVYGDGSKRASAHSLCGFLENGVIVCDGYAKTFQWMLHCLGVDAFLVYGKGSNDNHAWNKVRIDGTWYNADVCWDDTESSETYFLKSDTFFQECQHTYLENYTTVSFPSAQNYG